MWKYIVKRILMLIPVMLATIFVVYFIILSRERKSKKSFFAETQAEERRLLPVQSNLYRSFMMSWGWMILL